MKRRELIKTAGASASLLAVASCANVSVSQPVRFTHGVASGDPLSDRVILWTRVTAESQNDSIDDIVWQVASDRQFKSIKASGLVSTSAARDYTVKVDATGLAPNTRYFYRFLLNGAESPIGSTKTLPRDGVAPFRLGVASCSNYPQGYFHAYRDMANSDLDLVLHLGDYLYEYHKGRYSNPIAEDTLGRSVTPDHEILTVDDYRQRYALYRSDPDLQAVHAAHPFICVWDDHELMNNTWKDGAENHNEGEGDFYQRVVSARKAYHEWMPIRTAAQTDQSPIYRSFRIGDLADLIMLDTRVHGRDEQLDYQRDVRAAGGVEPFLANRLNDSNRTILGADQENWLGNQLAASKDRGAIWQLLGQQVLMGRLNMPPVDLAALEGLELDARARRRIATYAQFAALNLPLNLDAWDGYPACRERVHSMMKSLANNPVVLAGDTHNAWAFNMADASGEAMGIELGTPGISSPGMESWLPIAPDMLSQLFKASSPELHELDTSQRGWTRIELSDSEVRSTWRFINNILTSNYTLTESEPLVCRAGDRRFS